MPRAAKDTPAGARRRAGAEPDPASPRTGTAMREDPKFGPGQRFKDDAAGGNRFAGGLRRGKRPAAGGEEE